MTTQGKKQLAARIAAQLRELATACEQAAEGNPAAKKLLADHTDGYWFALCVGGREVEALWE